MKSKLGLSQASVPLEHVSDKKLEEMPGLAFSVLTYRGLIFHHRQRKAFGLILKPDCEYAGRYKNGLSYVKVAFLTHLALLFQQVIKKQE